LKHSNSKRDECEGEEEEEKRACKVTEGRACRISSQRINKQASKLVIRCSFVVAHVHPNTSEGIVHAHRHAQKRERETNSTKPTERQIKHFSLSSETLTLEHS
jgi:hypothetical protein